MTQNGPGDRISREITVVDCDGHRFIRQPLMVGYCGCNILQRHDPVAVIPQEGHLKAEIFDRNIGGRDIVFPETMVNKDRGIGPAFSRQGRYKQGQEPIHRRRRKFANAKSPS